MIITNYLDFEGSVRVLVMRRRAIERRTSDVSETKERTRAYQGMERT